MKNSLEESKTGGMKTEFSGAGQTQQRTNSRHAEQGWRGHRDRIYGRGRLSRTVD